MLEDDGVFLVYQQVVDGGFDGVEPHVIRGWVGQRRGQHVFDHIDVGGVLVTQEVWLLTHFLSVCFFSNRNRKIFKRVLVEERYLELRG